MGMSVLNRNMGGEKGGGQAHMCMDVSVCICIEG